MVIRMVIRMVSRMVIRMVSRMVILWLYGVLEGPQYQLRGGLYHPTPRLCSVYHLHTNYRYNN